MMYMKASDFRKDFSNQLNRVVRGEQVEFERGGILFNITAKGVVGTVIESPPIVSQSFVPTGTVGAVEGTKVHKVYMAGKDITDDFFKKDIEYCPHGYAKGLCKKADCNKRSMDQGSRKYA